MSIKTTKPVENTEKLGGRTPEYYIPERIENENGTAIKFADGTLICMKTVTVGDIDLTAHIGATYTHNYAISLGGFAFPFVGHATEVRKYQLQIRPIRRYGSVHWPMILAG